MTNLNRSLQIIFDIATIIIKNGNMGSQEWLQGLPSSLQNSRKSFGGSLLKRSHAKVPRPLSRKHALHIVLRSEVCKGSRSFLRRERLLQNLLLKQGRKHNVKVFRVTIASDHIHLLVRFVQRRGLQNFLRSICGIIARKTLQKERGPAHKDSQDLPKEGTLRFWDQRPFTRIVTWGPEFEKLSSYLKAPRIEAIGFIARRALETWRSDFIRKHVFQRLSLALS